MRIPRSFDLPLIGGPFGGRNRRVRRAPQELPAAIALPLANRRAAPGSPTDRLAVYQLKNDNGQWCYYHQRTATSQELGVEETRPNEDAWGETCPPLAP